MLLRHLIEHVRTQNWTAVFLDFVIVVTGVFIGLQVNNWNAARVEDGVLEQQLQSLQSEMSVNLIEFEKRLTQSQDDIEDIALLRRLLAEPDQADPEQVTRLFSSIFGIGALNAELGVFTELRESGGLRRLSGQPLYAQLVGWRNALTRAERNYEDALSHRNDQVISYFIGLGGFADIVASAPFAAGRFQKSQFSMDIATLAADQQLENQLALRFIMELTLAASLSDLAEDTREVLEALEQEK